MTFYTCAGKSITVAIDGRHLRHAMSTLQLGTASDRAGALYKKKRRRKVADLFEIAGSY